MKTGLPRYVLLRRYLANNEAGYTLIEMLFVVAIIAVISTLALTTVNKQSQVTRINKTALEMQQVLVAAMSYYNDYQRWPKPVSATPECQPSEDPHAFVQMYLPNGNTTSNYGTPYCWGYDKGEHSPKFWLTVQIPSLPEAQATQMFARRIAAQLPNAVVQCQAESCNVRAEISRPGTVNSNAAGMGVVAAGYCQPGDPKTNSSCVDEGYQGSSQVYQVIFNACVNGQARVTAMPNFYTYTVQKTSYRPIADLNAKEKPNSCKPLSTDPTKQSCEVLVDASLCGGSNCVHMPIQGLGSIGMSYIVACVANDAATAQPFRY